MSRKLMQSTLIALALTACSGGGGEEPIEPSATEAGLRRVADCDDLRGVLADRMLDMAVNSRYGAYWGVDFAESSSTDGTAPTDFTTTNVQEVGVDEMDIVKTDGQYLYITGTQDLQIVDAWPAEETHLVSSIELEGSPRGLLLRGDTLLIIEQLYAYEELDAFGGYGSTVLRVVDISDRAAPVITRTVDIEGYLTEGRLVESDAYLVLNHWVQFPEAFWDLLWRDDLGLPEVDDSLTGDAFVAAQEAAKIESRMLLRPMVDQIAAQMDLDDVLPLWIDQAEGAPEVDPTRMHACDDLYVPNGESDYSVLSIVQLDLDNGELSSTGLLSDGWTVYASLNNLYVARTSWWQWWDSAEDGMTTAIYQFELDPEDEPHYVATGEVSGWVYDQFAFSEYDGFLRVATTDVSWWWGWDEDAEQPANNVFVLQRHGDTLDEVGHLGGVAPGEQIFAVRMMGETGYVVTFEQTDPLFTVDLSDPTAPALLGELQVPGFSSYLHPVGDDYLLAVGMAGLDDGTLTGLAVNLFDVSDLSAPTLAHQYALEENGWAWSEALWDHHASRRTTRPTTSR